jgi:hypothetical protein
MSISSTMKTTAIVGALSIAAILAGCSNAPTENFRTITLNGNVMMTAGPLPQGTLHFRLFVLEALEGELQHPLSEIEDFDSESGIFSHTFEYPLHTGEGLAIHAWLDSDDDGIFCTPTSRLDPSGMAWQTETPENAVDMVITLDRNCRSSGWFYPPAP